jgi:tripartite-type tricarboxylate transporter receptor subunit TctC
MAESGVPKYEATIWLGLMAPKGTPPAIVERLNAEVGKIAANPDVAKAWKAQGATPMTMSTGEFTRYINDDIVKWAHIVKVSGAKAEE